MYSCWKVSAFGSCGFLRVPFCFVDHRGWRVPFIALMPQVLRFICPQEASRSLRALLRRVGFPGHPSSVFGLGRIMLRFFPIGGAYFFGKYGGQLVSAHIGLLGVPPRDAYVI
jgi:hypothetical protein